MSPIRLSIRMIKFMQSNYQEEKLNKTIDITILIEMINLFWILSRTSKYIDGVSEQTGQQYSGQVRIFSLLFFRG